MFSKFFNVENSVIKKIMRKENLKYLLLVFIGASIFAGFRYYEGNKKRETIINNLVYDALTTAHFSPKEINDEFSKNVYDKYLESLDYGKKYLTQKDIKEFESNKTTLDDQFKTNQLDFFDMSYVIVQARMVETKGYYEEFLSKPFNYDKKEEIETDSEKLDFASNRKELKDRWRKTLKLRVMSRVYDKLEDNDTLDFETAEIKARERELEYQNDLHEYVSEIDRIEWLGFYLNAFSAVFDPHSQYFAPKVKDKWEEEMTGQFEGIGAQLRLKGDYVTIEKVITGSASWRQGDLKAGDKILAVAQGDEEAVDVVGMKLDKVVKQIRGKKGTEVRLTVKKKDGTKEIIPIIRDIVELDQTFARSAVLGEEKKVGYIRLPKFYVDFYSAQNHNASEDVKNEIIRLKKENVEGIILDLRNNGGGSLKAAIDIAGLFIDKGPVVQVKNGFGKTRVHKDSDPTVYYDGPLVIMVNDFSASASEILAAALQDYGRAVIVGSKTTFGKGTVQNIFDMDKAAGATYKDVTPLGAIKVTTEKFYRINGGTTQLNGVTPDIILPNIYNNMEMGEKEEDFALPFDEIDRATYSVMSQNAMAYNSAKVKAEKRLAKNTHFNHVLDYAKWLEENEDNTTSPLDYAGYTEKQKKYKAELDLFDLDNKEDQDSIFVGFLNQKPEWYASDTAKVQQFEKWHKNLSKDAYLVETLNIIYDLGDDLAVAEPNDK
jgi:carboxyl-terminal processing protease